MERDTVREGNKPKTKISTHTLTWSVTLILKSGKAKMKNFNSHAHVERDEIKSQV